MNKKEFLSILSEYKEMGYEYFAVMVESPDSPKPEFIANKMVNLDFKLEYYDRAYDDEMKLKSFDKIKITDVLGFNSYSEIGDLY